jgi:glycosyltransferase involved in cell wall biosynthesis
MVGPEQNFGARSGCRSVLERRTPGTDPSWHPDAYAVASRACKEAGLGRIIVLGCGDGRLAAEMSRDAGIVIVGVDEVRYTEYAREKSPEHTWIGADLSRPDDLEALTHRLDLSRVPSLILLTGLLERLADIRPLLRTLKGMLLQHEESRLFLAAMDRAVVVGGVGTSSPPDPAHVREWSQRELIALLESNGFEVPAVARGRVRETDTNDAGIVLEVSLSRARYDAFLAHHHLPPSNVRALILTTENGKCRVSGGIGSYVEEKMALCRGHLAMGLLTSESNLPPPAIVNEERWIIPSKLDWKLGPWELSENTLRFVQRILCLYPDIHRLEFQDYLGIGSRLVQAKAAGLLPTSLHLEVVCHGTQVYLENASQTWLGADHLPTITQEKISLEGADRVVFPTRFLEGLYREAGYKIPADCVLRRYPFTGFSHGTLSSGIRKADTIIFFGKRTRMKGFVIFTEAMQRVLEEPRAAARVLNVILLGPRDDRLHQENAWFESLKGRVVVQEWDLPRARALKTLREWAPRAICVMPYLADNHPVAVSEAIAAGCQVVACRAGGIPELIPLELRERCLVRPNGEDLAELLKLNLAAPVSERRELVHALYAGAAAEQAGINDAAIRELELTPASIETSQHTSKGDVTVIVPCYNTQLAHVEELVWALNQQTVAPAMLVFVDDGSQGDYATSLEKLLTEQSRHPFEIVRHPVNRGLASARNTGLSRCTTAYVVNLDSDDVPRNDCLEMYVDELDRDPSVAAVTCYLDYFEDGTDWRLSANIQPDAYRPHGDGVIWALSENALGHANSAFRVEVLREMGGWDAQDVSMWEDWALFLKLRTHRHKVAVVPRGLCLYRHRAQSMARTYPKFPAQRRLARAIAGQVLDPFDALRVQALMLTAVDRPAGLGVDVPFRHRVADRLNNAVKRLAPMLHRRLRGVAGGSRSS